MRRRLVYIIGPPGVGKSTAMAGATSHWEAIDAVKMMSNGRFLPVTMLVSHNGTPEAIELGARRPDYSGTDALGMSVGPMVREWLTTGPHPLILAEGQRLATRPFLLAAVQAGYSSTLVYLDAAPELLNERCRARGSDQDPAWRKGAATRARNTAQWAEGVMAVIRIDASSGRGFVADEVRAVIMGKP